MKTLIVISATVHDRETCVACDDTARAFAHHCEANNIQLDWAWTKVGQESGITETALIAIGEVPAFNSPARVVIDYYAPAAPGFSIPEREVEQKIYRSRNPDGGVTVALKHIPSGLDAQGSGYQEHTAKSKARRFLEARVCQWESRKPTSQGA